MTAGYVQQATQAVDGGIAHWRGMSRVMGQWLTSTTQGVPVIGSMARGEAWLANQGAQVLGGLAKGGVGLAGGLTTMVVDPIDTVAGIGQMAAHVPGVMMPSAEAVQTQGLRGALDAERQQDAQFWSGVGNQILDPYRQEVAGGKSAEALGRGIFDIGSLLIDGGEGRAADAGGAARVAETTGGASRAAAAVEAAGEAGEASQAGAGIQGAGTPPGGAMPPGVAPRGPLPVQQMPAVPADLAPSTPPPPGWGAGPVGDWGPGDSVPHQPPVQSPAFIPSDAEAPTAAGGPAIPRPATPAIPAITMQALLNMSDGEIAPVFDMAGWDLKAFLEQAKMRWK